MSADNQTCAPPSTSTGLTGPLGLECPGKTGKKRNDNKKTLGEIALSFIRREGPKASCSIDSESDCQYTQEKLDVGNFIRHFRTRHPDTAAAHGLFKDSEVPVKKKRLVTKRPVAIDAPLLKDSLMKMITFHNLPRRFVQWEGFKQNFDPLGSACGITINEVNMMHDLKDFAQKLRMVIADEMKGRLVSLKIDSAARQNRHILGVNAQYAVNDQVVIRTLGMMEVKERQTARFLKNKVMELIASYGVGIDQVFSITCDNGANMLATVRQLRHEVELLTIDSNESDDHEKQDKELNEFTAAMCMELQENLNLVRCAVHTLQLAILDVVDKSHTLVKKVTDVAKKYKQIKYKLSFTNVPYPPVWGQTRWCGIYEMMSSFLEYEAFHKQLAQQFPEVDLGDTWDFIRQYEEAFKPLYICTKEMESKHVSLPDFYLRWLKAIREVRGIPQNPFSAPLAEALISRLQNLRQSRAFKIALFMDPRLNYKGSKLFTPEEKEQIQGYIIDTYNRICSYNNSKSSLALETSATEDDFDSFITEMFGECDAPRCDEATGSQFLQQLKALEVEPRQSHGYDVWQHWVNRRATHPELYAVAMVVLAVPSNQVSVERSFSALPLVLTDHRSGISEENLENILIVKLNKDLFNTVATSLFLPSKSSNTVSNVQ